MSSIDPSHSSNYSQLPPLSSGTSGDINVDAVKKNLEDAYKTFSSSTLSQALNEDLKLKAPVESKYNIALPGTENNNQSGVFQGSLTNLSNLLYLVISLIESMQRQVNTKLSVASANMQNSQLTMQLSSANAQYQAGMAQAAETKTQAEMSFISGSVSIVLGVVSIGAAFIPAASESSSLAKAATEGVSTGVKDVDGLEEGIEMSNMGKSTENSAQGAEASEESASVEETSLMNQARQAATQQAAEGTTQGAIETTQEVQSTFQKILSAIGNAAKRMGTQGTIQALSQLANGISQDVIGNIQQNQLSALQTSEAAQNQIATVEKAFADFTQQISSNFQATIQSGQSLQQAGFQALSDMSSSQRI